MNNKHYIIELGYGGDNVTVDPERITVVMHRGTSNTQSPAITPIAPYGSLRDNSPSEQEKARQYLFWGDTLLVYCDEMGIATPPTMPEDRHTIEKANFIKPGEKYYIRTSSAKKSPLKRFSREDVLYMATMHTRINNDSGDKELGYKKLIEQAEKRGIENAALLLAHMQYVFWQPQKPIDIKEEYHYFFFNTEPSVNFIYEKKDGEWVYAETSDVTSRYKKVINSIIKRSIEDNVIYFKMHFYIDTNDQFGLFYLTSNLTTKDLPGLFDHIKDLPTDAIINVIEQINPYYAKEETEDE